MVAIAGSIILSQLYDLELAGVSGDSSSDPIPDNPDTRQQQELQERYGDKPGSDEPSEPKKQPKKRKKSGKRNKKLLIFSGVGGLLTLIIGVAILFVIADMLKIQGLAQNITGLEFTRFSRQSALALARVVDESLAIQTASDASGGGGPSISLRQAIDERYRIQKPLLDKMSGLALDKISDNLRIADDIKFNYKSTKFGNLVLDSVELNGEVFKVPEQRGLLRSFIPKFLDIPYLVQAKAGQQSFEAAFVPAMEKALGEEGSASVATAVRSNVIIGTVLRELGSPLKVWTAQDLENYAKDTSQEAKDEVERDTFKAVTNDGTAVADHTAVSDINDGIDASHQATVDVVNNSNPAQLEAATTSANDGYVAAAGQAAEQALSHDVWRQAIDKAGVVTDLAITSCIIYEGSTERAGQTINIGTQNLERAFLTVETMADQEKAGSNQVGLLNAIGAMNAKLGDISNSNVYLRNEGRTPDTLATSVSTEANPMQEFTLLNAFFGNTGAGGAMASIVNAIASKSCPVLTHPLTAIGLAVGNVVLILSTAGGGLFTETTADGAADAGAETVTSNIVARITGTLTERVLAQGIGKTMGRVLAFLGKQVLIAGSVTGVTIIAKLIVMERSSNLYDGLEQGNDFADEADAGGNLLANESSRQTGGRPLTCSEVAQNDQLDIAQVAANMQAKSWQDRYISLNDSNSLLMHVANMTYSGLGSFTNKGFDPAAILGAPKAMLAYALDPYTGIATASAPCSQYYGNVQFGWSTAEETLIDNNNSYLPLENEQILEQSGKEDEIANTYAACFGYRYDSSGSGFDPTDSNSKLKNDVTGYNDDGSGGSIGALLSSGKIVRTANGDIATDQGTCSPQNLGPNNPSYQDLVFRLRVHLADYSELTKLDNLQTVTN